MPFDIIGDVHGQFDKLVGLLATIRRRAILGTFPNPA